MKHTNTNKILIVDDDLPIRVRSEAILKGEYIIATAENGKDALHKLAEFRPDLILLDVDMPGMSGIDVCRKVRDDSRFCFTKIIFVSGRTGIDERLTGYEAGGDDYITKPYDQEELLAKVKIMLRLKHEEQLSSMKSDFLSLISHETKTPLNSIMGFAHLLQNEGSKKTRERASFILKSGVWLNDFFEKATMLVNLKADFELKPTTNSVLHVMKSITKILDEKWRSKEVSVPLDKIEDRDIEADWALLTKAFLYVIDNAIKFSPAHAEVQITVETLSDKEAVITVADQGDGIKPDCLDKIFDEFAIMNIAHHQKGQGLSLAIVRHIINLHHGSIKARNGDNGGAMFTVSLPISFK